MVHKLDRTGSYPLMNLAQDFSLPVELVWSYAWQVKLWLLSGLCPDRPFHPTPDMLKAIRYALGPADEQRFDEKVIDHTLKFIRLQGSRVNEND